MCDGSATLQFLQNGRAGALFQKTKEDTLQEYHRIVSKSTATSNFAGCIAQVYLKTNQLWSATSTLPLPWSEVKYLSALLVIGLNPGYDCLEEHRELAKSVMRAACADRHRVVGLCAMLDYSIDDCRAAQLARALVTCKAAVEAEIPLQLKLFSGAVVARTECQENGTSPYLQLLQDVCMILETHPTVKMHLCSWTGLADDMMTLIHRFPGRVWIGLDGSVTFAKAGSLVHECAFDIPIECLLLETGWNQHSDARCNSPRPTLASRNRLEKLRAPSLAVMPMGTTSSYRRLKDRFRVDGASSQQEFPQVGENINKQVNVVW